MSRVAKTAAAERKAGRRGRTVTVSNRRPAGPDHEVVSVEGGSKGIRARPCGGCPWLVRNAGDFPPEAFVHSAPTAYDMATRTFACHEAGVEHPLTCAGAALRTDHSLSLRMRWQEVERVRDDAGELHENYRAMAEANGVDPDHPALRPCR